MRKILWKNELLRIFHGLGLWLSLMIGVILAVSHVLMYVAPLSTSIMSGNYPLGAYAKWMGGENSTIQPVLYYLIAPILIVLPYLGSINEDVNTGYVKNILLYVTRQDYCKVKWMLTFLTAGTVAVVPLLLNFFLTAMFLPTVMPQPGTGLYPLMAYSQWAELFYTHPAVYFAFYLALNFVFFGLLATVGLSSSLVIQKGYICMLFPLFLYLAVYGITQVTGLHSWCPFAALRPSQPVTANGWIWMTEFFILFFAGGVIWTYGWRKKDVF